MTAGSATARPATRLRVATYNIWNSDFRWEERLAGIIDELEVLAADVVVLQEAPNEASPGHPLAAYLAARTGYRQVIQVPYPEEEEPDERPEGLALVSKHPWSQIRTNWESGADTRNNWAVKIQIEIAGRTIGITNVHLDWEHPDGRIEHIADIVERVIDHRPADIEILCGDFNDYEDGPVAEYLAGARRGESRWQDAVGLSVGAAAAPVTLDFLENPRWAGTGSSERPGRFDRIYVRVARGQTMPRIASSGIFGRKPANRLGIVPSDHYGVFIDLEL